MALVFLTHCPDPNEPQAPHPSASGDFVFAPLFPSLTDALVVTGEITIGSNTSVTAVSFVVRSGEEIVQSAQASDGLPTAPSVTFTGLPAGTYRITMEADVTGQTTREPADFSYTRTVVVSDCGPGPMLVGDNPVPIVVECLDTHTAEDQPWCDEVEQQYRSTVASGLPTMQLDSAYSAQLVLASGVPPFRYQWADLDQLNAFALTGITVDPTGLISGTLTGITSPYPQRPSLRVADSCQAGARALFVPVEILTLCGRTTPSLVPPTTPVAAVVGETTSVELEWLNAQGSVTISIVSQDFTQPFTVYEGPDGAWFLEGVPTVPGTLEFELSLLDACSPPQEDRAVYTIEVAAAGTDPDPDPDTDTGPDSPTGPVSPTCNADADCTAYCNSQCEAPTYTYCEVGGHTCYCGCY